MNRIKNTLLVVLSLSVIGLATSQYYTRRVVAHSVAQVNNRWEYKVDSCTGPTPNCYGFTAAGLQGWELVIVSRGRDSGGIYNWDFVFKRPKS